MEAIIGATINTVTPARGIAPGRGIVSSSSQTFVAEFAMMVRVLAGAVIATTLAFTWTGYNLFHSPPVGLVLSLGVGTALLVLCLITWLVAARAMICCRLAAERGANIIATQEKLLEERDLLRDIIDNLPDYVYAKDREGRFVFNNLAHARSFGVASPRELIGKSDLDFFPAEQAGRFRSDEQRILESEQPLINQEQHSIHREPDGQRRWCCASKVLWRGPDGQVLGTVGLTRDIHERKQAEEKLRQFAAQLERSNRELQDFAYVASHDLQEPLRKIVMFGERLKERSSEALGEDGRDYLDRMQKAATRMQTLINDLLSFSRVTTKARPFVPVSLTEIATDVVHDLEGRIEQVKGRVELGELPVIDADPLQMRQLLQNLIGNALKFRRPEEPPLVKVHAQAVDDPHGGDTAYYRLTVSDNGIGFDEKYLDRIFNVFQRLHTRAEYEGTGMGLAIARKIACHHGGGITAESKPGCGATFIVTLPAVQAKEANHL